METLINSKNFKSLHHLKTLRPKIKGIYAVRIRDFSTLTILFENEPLSAKNTLIYIGIGKKRTIYDRLCEEFDGKSNGTFFRGIGALLGFRPAKGSLIGKKNTNNYRFSETDRQQISNWMYQNLDVNFIEIKEDFERIEKELIEQHCPILNYTHNPRKSEKLIALRLACRQYGLSR